MTTVRSSPLLSLSPELRNFIYSLVIPNNETIYVVAGRKQKYGGPDTSALSLTAVCRQLRAETLSLFYGANEFNITLLNSSGLATATRWILHEGENMALLRHIRFCGQPPHKADPVWHYEAAIAIRFAPDGITCVPADFDHPERSADYDQDPYIIEAQLAKVRHVLYEVCGCEESWHLRSAEQMLTVMDAFYSMCWPRSQYQSAMARR